MEKKDLCLVCQVTPSWSQICKEVQKPCCSRRPGWLSFLDDNHFYLPEISKYFFWGGLAPAHQVIKKLRMDHVWVYTLYFTSCCNAIECDKKSKSACQLLKFWMHVLGREINIFTENLFLVSKLKKVTISFQIGLFSHKKSHLPNSTRNRFATWQRSKCNVYC